MYLIFELLWLMEHFQNKLRFRCTCPLLLLYFALMLMQKLPCISLCHTGLIPQWVQDEPGGPKYDMRDYKWRRYNCYFEDGFETHLSDE